MNIICVQDYQEMSRKAADLLSEQIAIKENSVLGLATGGTVLGIYDQLNQSYRRGALDFSKVSTINLDEYVGLSPDHPDSYRYYMEQNLFSRVNLIPENCHLPNGLAESIEYECLRYDQLIPQLGGIDMLLLGLGCNGHIGFNEPPADFEKETHCVVLSDSTRRANARFFDSLDEVPTHATTMGIKSILQTRHILLCVSGTSKAEILQKVLFGPVTPEVPGSILQTHPNVTVIADRDARSCLPEEYRK